MVVLLLLASCDEVERHRMLTFFFDGVPPLGGETAGVKVSNLKKEELAGGSVTGGWHVHEPVKDCTACHGSQRQRTFSRQVQLVAQVPQLCHQCHQEYTALEGWVHGPVATGDCLLCHEPHKTKNEFLLVKPVPDLCYQCHEPEAVRTIAHHAEESYAHCIDCHEGHAGTTRSLLRPVFLSQPGGSAYLSEIQRRQFEESQRRARSDLARGGSLGALLETGIHYVQSGQLLPARAYLEVLMGSEIATEAQKSQLAAIVWQIIALQRAQGQENPQDAEAAGSLGLTPEEVAAALRAMRDQNKEQDQAVAALYYDSIKLYHAGQLAEARDGFRRVLATPALPEPVRTTAQSYLERIEQALQVPQQPGWRLLDGTPNASDGVGKPKEPGN